MKNLFLYLLMACALPAFAKTKLPQFFSHGMVVQQNAEVSIWGTDEPGTIVRVAAGWNDNSTARADEQGKWRLKILTPKAGGPYQIRITGSTEVVINDVLAGEVWFCSGQSNMEMPVMGRMNQPVKGSNEMILNSANDQIRLFTVKKNACVVPVDDVKGSWFKASPENTGSFSAVAYAYGKKLQQVLNVPVGLIVSSWGGSTVEAWMDQQAITAFSDIKVPAEIDDKRLNRTPSLLYNGMVHPLVGYTIKGCLWYQGENNVVNHWRYQDYFTGMISCWRKNWEQGNFPFYFVQIAPFDYGKNQSGMLRDAQLRVMKSVENTGMAVTTDIGMCNLIHPPEKEVIGDRLAYWALANTYTIKGITHSGPVYKSIHEIKGNRISIHFDYAANGLYSTSTEDTGFEVAGEDKVFYPARIEIGKKGALVVWSDKVSQPVALRYAFANCAAGTLFNTAGLPAATFRTDNW